MAVTATRSEPASARRWVRPIRPAPIRPSRNGGMLKAPFGQERAVVPLFGAACANRPALRGRMSCSTTSQPPNEILRSPASTASTSRSPPPSAQNASLVQISVTGA